MQFIDEKKVYRDQSYSWYDRDYFWTWNPPKNNYIEEVLSFSIVLEQQNTEISQWTHRSTFVFMNVNQNRADMVSF